MNAISNFSSSLARHGQYGKRPKVEMPEKTESACERQRWSIALFTPRRYLCSAIPRYWPSRIIPQALVRSSDWLLVMVAVSNGNSNKATETERLEQHGSKSIEFEA